MKTKQVTLSKTNASFSSVASQVATVTLPRAPWEPEVVVPATPETPKAPPLRAPSHLGSYTRKRKA